MIMMLNLVSSTKSLNHNKHWLYRLNIFWAPQWLTDSVKNKFACHSIPKFQEVNCNRVEKPMAKQHTS